MKTLFDILREVDVQSYEGPDAAGLSVAAIRFDSRMVGAGDVFIAVKGQQSDGHNYLLAAAEKGAVALVGTRFPENIPHNCAKILVKEPALALGLMASNFYEHPSRALTLVGVTGTNGKTTVSTLLHQIFSESSSLCGLIGTVENRIGDQVLPSTHTTPDAVGLQQILRKMQEAGCRYVFMEVSSHAIHQHRIAGTHFKGAVFTNLTHDHLDYHGSFAAYRDAKKMLFDQLPADAFALVNADDRNGLYMLQNTAAAHFTYGLKHKADFKGKILENSLNGLHLRIDGTDVHMQMIGEFNAANLLAAYAVRRLLLSNEDVTETLTLLSKVRGAEGRFEPVQGPGAGPSAIVDYAHTPDALEKTLETIQKIKKRQAKIITVVGCGGDRDKTKRPLMAAIAARLSNQLILTSDNPRTENPYEILADMEAGLDAAQKQQTLIIENREQAIKTACKLAGKEDVILVAGKGHEKYQEIHGVKHPFDDKKILEDGLQ